MLALSNSSLNPSNFFFFFFAGGIIRLSLELALKHQVFEGLGLIFSECWLPSKCCIFLLHLKHLKSFVTFQSVWELCTHKWSHVHVFSCNLRAPTLSSFHRAITYEAAREIISLVCALYGRLFIRNSHGLRACRQHNQGGVLWCQGSSILLCSLF